MFNWAKSKGYHKPSFKRKAEDKAQGQGGDHHANNNGHNVFKQPRLSAPSTPNSVGTPTDRALLKEQRKALPMFQARNKFLEQVNQHPTVILIGETGSGKTTQVPQFLHEVRLDSVGSIAVTQPRRMAAVSIAQRVATEMDVELGTMVGYKVRFEDVSDAKSKIVFLTDGMLLREAMLDPNLSRYSWVILDEAHERTVNTDVLFGVVKAAQVKRKERQEPPLKIIVMSATLEADRFSKYFRNAPVLFVEGRQHPINVHHTSTKHEDWQGATLSSVFHVHQTAPEREDILVFLTGQEDIESFVSSVKQIAKEYPDRPKVNAMGLFASQNPNVQKRLFEPTKAGQRKIIVATNIAETSLTIPGVRYVIDSCRVKAKVHQASTGLDMLKVVKISQAQAMQRTGRAGRESEGHCYRMLTHAEFKALPVSTTPEILRCNLSSVMLQMMSLGVKDVAKFDFVERPPEDAIEGAERLLKLLGAIGGEDGKQMTDLGKKMAAFPLDPKFTKVILNAKDLGCTEEIITIVAILSGESILITPTMKREEAHLARKKFISTEGDHVTYLKIFRAYKAASNQNEWCQQHFINSRNMKFAVDVRKQLMELCRKESVPVQSAGDNTEVVRKALAEGLFTNVARRNKEGNYVTLDSRQQVKIHPSSVMFQMQPEVVVFTELISTQKSYIRDLSLVDAMWLIEAQPAYFRKHRILPAATS